MRTLWTVFAKEVLENLRDRRTLFSALVMGPLLGPVLFGAMISRIVAQNAPAAQRPLAVMIEHGERAPNLVQYLEGAGVQVRAWSSATGEAGQAVERGAVAFLLRIPADYGRRFAAGTPARLELIEDSSNNRTRSAVARLHALIATYASGLAQQRLAARGVDPLLAMPVAIDEVDVATPAARAVAVIGFMTYFVLFAVLMGGLYLAIDVTAGERERGSLEPLLSLPVRRTTLLAGKLLATSLFMCLSLAISLSAFTLVFRFVSLDRLGMQANFGAYQALEFFAIGLPFVPLGAALMGFVASFTRSYREAQSYLGAVLLVPTLPIAFASIYSLKIKTYLMLIPSLSQHLLMTQLLQGKPLDPVEVLVSAGTSLAGAALLFVATGRHWRRETMLG
ncbi:MAG: ABC transporter permease [Gammaproteobacteria bacterium]|nr:ABC transporter permease [Gammaproteobacteria bacterium]